MGHYRQWLQYREIDQHLHTQLSELELEMARLQQEADELVRDLSLSDNAIIRGLIGHQKAQEVAEAIRVERAMYAGQADAAALAGGLVESGSVQHNGANGALQTYASENGTDSLLADGLSAEETNPLLVGGALLPSYTVSPALFGWSNLTDFDEEQAPIIPITLSSLPSVPTAPVHQEPNLLPEDLHKFLDMHARNSAYHPTLHAAPSWWLAHNVGSTPAIGSQERGPVDQQSIRTDRLIQRWSERWGRVAPDPHDQPRQPERQEDQV